MGIALQIMETRKSIGARVSIIGFKKKKRIGTLIINIPNMIQYLIEKYTDLYLVYSLE